jgi:multidrug efflux pump subunit AcrB
MLLIYRQLKFLLLIVATFVVNLSIAAIFYYIFNIEIHLYSLAGITVSLGLMTDNIIVMGDHLRNRGNLSAWLAILAGTLAMASTLVIIFFLDEKIKANLVDFALIVIVNQSISLVTALFFVPALMESLQLRKKGMSVNQFVNVDRSTKGIKRQIRILKVKIKLIWFQRALYKLIGKWRWLAYLLFIIGFGIPVFMLPPKWSGENWYHHFYNKTLGSETYTSNIKPVVDKFFGGSLRLFVNYVFEGSYFSRNEETSLYITASLPHGSTIEQSNNLAGKMELWLRQFNEIKTFQTNVEPRHIWIMVYFKKESQRSAFPYQLKGMAVSKAIELGGAYWGVYGFGDGFSNETRENAGMYTITMWGYNYDKLIDLAEKLKLKLQENQRLQEVYILPERSWFKPDNTEFNAKVNAEKACLAKISPLQLFSGLKAQTLKREASALIYLDGKFENIILQDKQAAKNDVWLLDNLFIGPDSSAYRFKDYCSIKKELRSASICKENQQYRIYLQFDYIGSDKFARKYIKKTVEQFQPLLPLGYTVKDNNDWLFWLQMMDKNQYWLIGLVILTIFFICSILFESLKYPLAVILTIPVSFIGVFLTFYLFDLNFDQGGFAAFIMLCGLTVSAAIYIVNDYSVLKRLNKNLKRSNLHIYLKAFQYKIIPILLSMSATILGFIPFLTGAKQAFWFSMAAGVCGGLVFALLGIFFYLPLFLGIKFK